MRYCEVLQRGGARVYRCAIKAPRVTRTGTYGTGRAPQSGCFGLLLLIIIIVLSYVTPWKIIKYKGYCEVAM